MIRLKRYIQGSFVRNIIMMICLLGLLGFLAARLTLDEYGDSDSEMVDIYLTQNDNRSAIILLKNVLQKKPDDSQARMMLGNSYLITGQLSSAEKEHNQAHKLAPENPEINIALAKTLFQVNKFRQMEDLIDNTQGWPTALIVQSYALKARLSIYHGDIEQAENLIAMAVNLQPDETEVLFVQALLKWQLRDIDEAKIYLKKLAKKEPSHIRGLVLTANIAFWQKDYEEANEKFAQASEIQYRSMTIKLHLVGTLIAQRKLVSAKKALKKLLKKDVNNPYINHLMARVAFLDKDNQSAARHADIALMNNSGAFETNYIAAAAKYSTNKFEQAYKHIGKVTLALPNHVQALKLKAAIQLKLGLFDQAIDTLLKVSGKPLQSADAALLQAAGQASRANTDYERSLALFQQASELRPLDTSITLDKASVLFEKGNFVEGIAELERAVELEPGSASARIALILGYFQTQQSEKALASAVVLSQVQPDNHNAFTLQGLAYVFMKQIKKAKLAFNKALSIQPGDANASQNLAALVLQQDNDIAQAKQLHQAVIKLEPGNMNSLIQQFYLDLQSGNSAQAIAWLKQAIAANPKALPPVMLLAQLYLSQTQPALALAISAPMLASNPDNTELLALVADALWFTGQTGQAINKLERLVKYIPDQAELHYRLAVLYQELSQFALARKALSKALLLNPEHLGALFTKGQIALKTGYIKQAGLIAQKLHLAQPDNFFVLQLTAHIALANKKPSQAVNLYQNLLKKSNSNFVNIQLAEALWQQGSRVQAIANLAKWLERYPQDILTLHAIANSYLRDHQFDNALLAFKSIIKHSSNNIQAQNNVAWLLLQKGDAKNALNHARQANRLAPTNVEVMDTLGMILLENGDYQAAQRVLVDAARLVPHNLNIQYHLAQSRAKLGENIKAQKILKKILSRENRKISFSYRQAAKHLLDELKQQDAPLISG